MDERKRVEITAGMANAMGREGTGPARVCSKCSLKVPRYPGRYPENCPACGGKLRKPAKAYESIGPVVAVSRVPRIQAVIEVAREMGGTLDDTCSVPRVVHYKAVDERIPGGVTGLTMFLEGPKNGVHYRVEGVRDPVLIFELDDANERVRIYATSCPEGVIGFDPRPEMIESVEETAAVEEPTIATPPGSLGIPRSQMPQIAGGELPRFLEWIKAQGVTWTRKAIPVNQLRATQRDLNMDKVKKFVLGAKADPKVRAKLRAETIVSSDHRIMDGHHRWAALWNFDQHAPMEAVVVNLPMRELLALAAKFPGVFYKDIDESLDEDELDEFESQILYEIACGGGFSTGAGGAGMAGGGGAAGQFSRKSINAPRPDGKGAQRAVGRTRFEIGANRKLDPRKDILLSLQNARNAKRGLAKRIKAAKEWHTKTAQGSEYHRSLGRYNQGGHRGQPVPATAGQQVGQVFAAPPRVESMMDEDTQHVVMHTVHNLIHEWQSRLGSEFKVILGGSLVSGLFVHQGAKVIDVDVRFLTDTPDMSAVHKVEAATGHALKYRKTIKAGDWPEGSSDAHMVEGFIEIEGIDLPLEVEGQVRNFKYIGWASYYQKVLTPHELEVIRQGKADLRHDKAAYKAFKARWRDEVEKRAVSRGLVKIGEALIDPAMERYSREIDEDAPIVVQPPTAAGYGPISLDGPRNVYMNREYKGDIFRAGTQAKWWAMRADEDGVLVQRSPGYFSNPTDAAQWVAKKKDPVTVMATNESRIDELGPGGVGILPSMSGANPERKTIDDLFDACLRKLITIESQDILQDVEFTEEGGIYFFIDPSIDDQEVFEVLTVLRSADPRIEVVGSPDARLPGETEPAQWWVMYLPPMSEQLGIAPPPEGVPDTTPPDEERGVEPEAPKQQMVVQGKTDIDTMAGDIDLAAAVQAVGESLDGVRALNEVSSWMPRDAARYLRPVAIKKVHDLISSGLVLAQEHGDTGSYTATFRRPGPGHAEVIEFYVYPDDIDDSDIPGRDGMPLAWSVEIRDVYGKSADPRTSRRVFFTGTGGTVNDAVKNLKRYWQGPLVVGESAGNHNDGVEDVIRRAEAHLAEAERRED